MESSNINLQHTSNRLEPSTEFVLVIPIAMSIVWNPQVVTIVVGISLIPATFIALVCGLEWQRQRAQLRSVYAAQAIASVLHLADQVLFLLILVVPASRVGGGKGCFVLTILPPVLFGIMQPLAVLVLVLRVTALLPSSLGAGVGTREWLRSKKTVRVGIGTVFAIGWSLVVTSQIRGKWGINTSTDRCLYVPDRSINVVGKGIYLATYTLIGTTYLSALTRHGVSRFRFRTSAALAVRHGESQGVPGQPTFLNPPPTRDGPSPNGKATFAGGVSDDVYDATRRLNKALLSVMYRILLAVLTYFLTSSLALANFFSGGAYVQFTIENTCAVLASTFATLSHEQDWKAKQAAAIEVSTTTVAATATIHDKPRRVGGVSAALNLGKDPV